MLQKREINQAQWCTPLIPALGRQRQADISDFEASLVYTLSSRTARTKQRDPVSKIKTKNYIYLWVGWSNTWHVCGGQRPALGN